MTAPVLDILHMIGSIVDDMLAICDILSLLATCKDRRDEPSNASKVLMYVQASALIRCLCDADYLHFLPCPVSGHYKWGTDGNYAEHDRKPLLRRMLNFARPLSLHRANVVLDSANLLRTYHRYGPPPRLVTLYHKYKTNWHPGLRYTSRPRNCWVETMEIVDSWVWEHPDRTITEIEIYVQSLMTSFQ